MVENLPILQETWVQSLGLEDPLEKRVATHSSILAWRIPWTEEPGGLLHKGSQRVRHDWVTERQQQQHFVCVCVLSHVWLYETPWTVAHQAPLSMEFSRQECWIESPFPSPGDLPNKTTGPKQSLYYTPHHQPEIWLQFRLLQKWNLKPGPLEITWSALVRSSAL